MATVSIIVPTYNRLPRLRQVLAALERQQYPLDKLHLIVVSDGSTDGTNEYFASLSTPLELSFVPQTNAGPAAARNNGIRHAKGEYVLFIDDDVVPGPELVREHMRFHDEGPNRVVLGPMINPQDFTLSPWVSWEQAMLEKQYRAMRMGDWHATARQFYTGNTSLPHSVLVASGGFDERFRRAEDVELAYRLEQQGVTFIFNIDAIGYHYAERSFSSWLQTPYAYGRNDVVFSRERQKPLLGVVRAEFAKRNRMTQILVQTLLDRPRLSGLTQTLIKQSATLSHRLGSPQLAQAAYSAIFNLRYYQGIADELGGRDAFFGQPAVNSSQTPAQP